MNKRIITAAATAFALAGLTIGVMPASAATTHINFDDYALGTVNGQNGWTSTGGYDQEIVAAGKGQALRISNAVTSGSFGDQTFSPRVAAASETALTHFDSSFDIKTTSDAVQPDLRLSVSPDSGTGGRMSYLRFEDQADGVHVFFDDVTDAGPFYTMATFNESDIGTLTHGAKAHTVKFIIDFVKDGADVVTIRLDGKIATTGTTWENYYRFDNENQGGVVPPEVTSMLFRAGGTAVPANKGNGFLINDVTLASHR
ncbi:MAG: hypothetical protein ABI899_06730 [Actinomycetota bacterium]